MLRPAGHPGLAVIPELLYVLLQVGVSRGDLPIRHSPTHPRGRRENSCGMFSSLSGNEGETNLELQEIFQSIAV